MSNLTSKNNSCGCCKGVELSTPALINNNPGLNSLSYRVGTHSTFINSMQTRLSGLAYLKGLKTRNTSDPTIALCDAWATVLDVLSFYQERIANEGFLRTAIERKSILELVRSIGYELKPGVAAGTYLAFKLNTAKGSPETAIIPVATRAQTIPGQDEFPQVFETVEETMARTEWNAIRPLLSEKYIPGYGDKEIYLKGILTGLKPGDGLLMIGAERMKDSDSERWDFRRIKEVKEDSFEDITKVTWDKGLGWQIFSRKVLPAKRDFKVFAFRQTAFLFGYNAPDLRTISDFVKTEFKIKDENKDEWPNLTIESISQCPPEEENKTIYLNMLYPKITEGSWLVLTTPVPNYYVEVYEVKSVLESSRKDFTLNAKTTAVILDGEHLKQKFNNSIRDTVVFCQSEELEITNKPFTLPVEGKSIVLEKFLPTLKAKKTIIINGKRMRVKINDFRRNLLLKSADGIISVKLNPEDSCIVIKAPETISEDETLLTLQDKNGFIGSITVKQHKIIFVDSLEDDEIVSEVNTIDSVIPDSNPTVIELMKPLENIYDRKTVSIYGNVVRATHGETQKEILGSGDASKTNQRFFLKQKPLTFVSDPSSGGTKTTLSVRVNDILWDEVSSLYNQSPDKRIYTTRISEDGTVTLQTGDGKNGTRLPSGVENVSVNYRIGVGTEGNVKSGKISLLMSQILGVNEVTNPLPSSGAEDPEITDNARNNAPLTILTMDRIVSLKDYESYTNGFAGIEKAQANIVWDGEKRIIHLTIAGINGCSITKDSDIYINLVKSINSSRHSDQKVIIEPFTELKFNLSAKILVDDKYITENVFSEIRKCLTDEFSFNRRSFGQAVSSSEVIAAIQKVDGVIATRLTKLYINDRAELLNNLLPEIISELNVSINKPAKILHVNPQGIFLEEMI